MSNSSIFSRSARIAGLLTGAVLIPTASAPAATGTTDLTIGMPDMVILHYYSSATVNMAGTTLTSYLFAVDSMDEGSASATPDATMTADLSLNPDDPTTPVEDTPLVLRNAWAVRSINNGDTQLAITIASDTLTNGSSEIKIDTARVDAGNGSGGGDTIQFPPPGLDAPEIGSMVLELDLTNAFSAGSYTGGQVQLEAINL